jgi:hypothetical protein
MAFTPDTPFPKSRGHVIKSKDWNDAITEVQRLDTAKVNKSGDSITGPLTISGNVGIGLTSPQKALSVNAALNVDQANANSGAVNPGVTFGSASGEGMASKRTAGGNQFGLDLYTGSAVRLSITNGGNVGIGTQTPNRSFHVVGSEMHSGGGGAGYSFGNRETATFVEGPGSGERWVWYAAGGNARLWSGSDRLAVTPGGNVGIGTTAPADRLDVAGNLRILTGSNPIRFTSGWSGFPDPVNNQAEISNDTGTYKTLMIIGNKSGGLGRRVSVWDRLEVNGTLFANGSVGVRTISPLVTLHTVGNRIRIDNGGGHILDLRTDGAALDLESNGADLYINNNNIPVRIRNQQSVSTRDLKDNITDFTMREATEALEDLCPVSFTWKDDEEKAKHLGFIAEDAPGIAKSTDDKAIIPMHILAILSKVVREQQRVISSMRERLLELGDA